MMQVDGKGIMLIKSFEGCWLKSYKDIVGVLTIGYGHTGPDVHEGQRITEAEAEWLLKLDLKLFEISVSNLVKSAVSQNQFDALASFAYNLGAGTLKRSTLLKKVNANPMDESIRREFLKYVRAGGKVVNGLVKRRSAEADLFFLP